MEGPYEHSLRVAPRPSARMTGEGIPPFRPDAQRRLMCTQALRRYTETDGWKIDDARDSGSTGAVSRRCYVEVQSSTNVQRDACETRQLVGYFNVSVMLSYAN